MLRDNKGFQFPRPRRENRIDCGDQKELSAREIAIQAALRDPLVALMKALLGPRVVPRLAVSEIARERFHRAHRATGWRERSKD